MAAGCDLNPSDALAESGEGVYYQLITVDDPRLNAFNKLVVEYQVPVWGGTDGDLFHFEVMLMGDGTVIMQYLDMPTTTGSWSTESIGFEDRSGTMGAQVLYGAVPASRTAYAIPPSCHVLQGEHPEEVTCCSSSVCQCEGLRDCVVDTDFPYQWVDILSIGHRITDDEWVNNRDDGWFHVDLPFPFYWFGSEERMVTIGTNGYLTFGDEQLPYGDSEPVPCQWIAGAGQGAGGIGCVAPTDDSTSTGGHYGVEIDGIIAIFCKLGFRVGSLKGSFDGDLFWPQGAT